MTKQGQTQKLEFPQGFLWGAATAAHQVEGNNTQSDWWTWEKDGGGTEPSGRACDHYNRFEEDFELAKSLGHNAHRLSIEWARIEPEEGKWDEREMEHYRKVLQSLKDKNMAIFVTLFHFTLPLWFAKKGGFERKENLRYFNRFVNRAVCSFKNLVDFWITINEPNIYVTMAYLLALRPPQKRNISLALKVYRNLAAAHRLAYRSIHNLHQNAEVGVAVHLISFMARRGRFLSSFFLPFARFIVNDSFYFLTKECHDFLGANYYFSWRASLRDLVSLWKLKRFDIGKAIEPKRSDLGWLTYPKGIYDVVTDLKKYNLPIYITENGIWDAEDKYRKKFIINNLRWLHQAIKEGADVRGYLYWSLMDNFEWDLGFKPRPGLAEINYATQKRRLRASAITYARVCKENSLLI